MSEFSICRNCRSAVDLHDTFRETCPECGCDAAWIDNDEALHAYVAEAQRRAREEEGN
jgi:Zn finger protein HypA/HybF involved in hydrogenase expression